VEGGVEAGYRRRTREQGGDRVHARQGLWLMQRRELGQLLQCLPHRRVDANRAEEPVTAVHDAVSHGVDLEPTGERR
jgi:hypothetical protein